MKKLIFTLFALAIAGSGFANDSTKQKKTPEQVATKKADKLKTELSLSDDQRSKVYNALLDRETKVRAVKAKYPTDKKAARKEIKPINEACNTTITSALTPEQATKWEQMKKDKKEKHKQNKTKKRNSTP
ncbi:MAG: hypothetical protein V4613_01500 [Bacteroidota bacterium]